MILSNSTLKTLRTVTTEAEYDQAEDLSRTAMDNCNRLGSQAKFQTNELDNKILGYLGEIKFAKAMKDRDIKGHAKLDASGKSDEGDDWVSEHGIKVDVKTRKWSVAPKPWHYWPIIKSNADHHPPDVYVLCTVFKDYSASWIVGGLRADHFKKIAEFKRQGDSLGSCNARRDAYAIRYHQIAWNFDELCEKLKKLRRYDFEN